MSETRRISNPLIWGVPIVALLAIFAAFVIRWADRSRSDLPILGNVPAFTLTTQDGKVLSRPDLNGRLHVVNFMFTRCKGICPTMTANLKELYDLYRGSDKVRFLSVSVDPDYDSLTVLTRYAQEHQIDDGRWLFAHGTIDAVRQLIEGGFMLDASDLPGGHPARIVLLDQFGQIRGYYTYDDEAELDLLRQNIRSLARAM